MANTPRTYCNPMSLPDYPRGRACRDKTNGSWGWRNNGRPGGGAQSLGADLLPVAG